MSEEPTGRSSLIPWLVIIGIVFGVTAITFSVHRLLVSDAIEEGRPIVEAREQQEAEILARTGRADTLKKLYTVLLEKLEESPFDSMMVISAANVAYDLGEYSDAERFYRQYLKNIDNSNNAIKIDLGFTVFQQGRQDEAIELLQGVLDSDPKNQTALFNMAYMSEQVGDVEGALNWMKKCRDADPGSSLGIQAARIVEEREEESD